MNQPAPSEPCLSSVPPFDTSDGAIRQLVENVPEVFWVTNADATQLIYVSPAFETVWGRSCQSLFEKPLLWMESIHAADRHLAEFAVVEAIAKGECSVEFRIYRPDGSTRWIRDRAFPVRDKAGEIVRIAGVAADITDWKLLVQELEKVAEHHRLISDLTSDYAYTSQIGADGNVVVDSFSEGFTRVTGYTMDDVRAGGGWPMLIHPDDLESTRRINERLVTTDRVEGELRIITKDKQVRQIRYSSQMYASVPGGPRDRIVGASQDITERHVAQERMRELSHRLIEVQEQERRHLARELHDEIGQLLTALCLNLDAALRPDTAETMRHLEQARGLAKDLYSHIRDLSLQLRPTLLDDLGLVPALLWLVDRTQARTKIEVNFQHSGLSRRFKSELETAAYRIVQEALTNAVKHSGSRAAAVNAWVDDGKLHLTIEDTGRGFDVDAAIQRRTSAGLSGMQERAVLLDGEFFVESIPGRGTHVSAHIPIGDSCEGEST